MGTLSPKIWTLAAVAGRRVRRLRSERGESAAELARQVGYERKLVYRLESGERKLDDLSLVFALAATLNVPPLVLLLPADGDELVELIPGHPPMRARDAYAWIIGAAPLPAESDTSEPEGDQSYQVARGALHKYLPYINNITARVAGIDISSSQLYKLIQSTSITVRKEDQQ